MAKEHEKARELERIQRYHMPVGARQGEMEIERNDPEPPQSEQNKWESEQMNSAVFRFGAKDRKGKSFPKSHNFLEYLKKLVKSKIFLPEQLKTGSS